MTTDTTDLEDAPKPFLPWLFWFVPLPILQRIEVVPSWAILNWLALASCAAIIYFLWRVPAHLRWIIWVVGAGLVLGIFLGSIGGFLASVAYIAAFVFLFRANKPGEVYKGVLEHVSSGRTSITKGRFTFPFNRIEFIKVGGSRIPSILVSC